MDRCTRTGCRSLASSACTRRWNACAAWSAPNSGRHHHRSDLASAAVVADLEQIHGRCSTSCATPCRRCRGRGRVLRARVVRQAPLCATPRVEIVDCGSHPGRHPRQLLPTDSAATAVPAWGVDGARTSHGGERRHDRVQRPPHPASASTCRSPSRRTRRAPADNLFARDPQAIRSRICQRHVRGPEHCTVFLLPRSPSAVNPVWIIDDDRSIRWVFEKALAREGIAHRTLFFRGRCLDTLAGRSPQVVVSDIRMPGVESGLDLCEAEERLPRHGLTTMTAFTRSGQRGGRLPGRSVGVPARSPSMSTHPSIWCAARSTRAQAQKVREGRRWPGRPPRDPRPGAGDAGSVSRHRPARPAIHRAPSPRIGHRQGAGRTRAAPT